jgi:hypothetical protein
MTEKNENEATVVHEVERAELAQVEGGWSDGSAGPLCGTVPPPTSAYPMAYLDSIRGPRPPVLQ